MTISCPTSIVSQAEGPLPPDLEARLVRDIASVPHPKEKVIDVFYALQRHYGWMSDNAMAQASRLLGMTLLELEELATFYDYVYREPVGRYVIHVCDGVVCWMNHDDRVIDYLCRRLGVEPGHVTFDGLFTVLPAACIGYCHKAPAMLVNGVPYGPLTPEEIDRILAELRAAAPEPVECR